MDDITEQFETFVGRPPGDGDVLTEQPTKVLDAERGDLVAIRQCWRYQNGRWEAFTSISRGAPWAR